MALHLAIFRRELREALLTPRAWLVFAVAAAFLCLAFVQGAGRVQAQREAMALAEAANWKGWTSQEVQSPHAAAHYPLLLVRPPAPLSVVAEGVEGAMGGHLFLDAHRVVPVSGTAAGDLPIAGAVGGLDLAFVVAAVLSLLAVVWGADMVAGEKERGTLRLVFSNPVGRRAWLFTKLTAHALVLLGVVGAALALSAAVAGLSLGVPLGEGASWRVAGWLLASAAYLLAWFGVGVACSTASTRVGPAAMASLGLWVLLVVVLPRTVVAAAEAAWPPPPTAPAHMAIRVSEVELMQEQQALVAAAEARGELKGKSAIVQSEGTQEIRDRIDAKARAARAEAEGPMQAWKLGMARRLEAWAYLSPAALYLRAATAFAGTDAARQQAFVEQAGAWRQATLKHLNGLEESGVSEFNDYERLSRFHLVEASSGAVWGSTWGPLLALALLAAGLWAWSLGRFARYDLR